MSASDLLVLNNLIDTAAQKLEPESPGMTVLAQRLKAAIVAKAEIAHPEDEFLFPVYSALVADRDLAKDLGVKITGHPADADAAEFAVRAVKKAKPAKKDKLRAALHLENKTVYSFAFDEGPNLLKEVTNQRIYLASGDVKRPPEKPPFAGRY